MINHDILGMHTKPIDAQGVLQRMLYRLYLERWRWENPLRWSQVEWLNSESGGC